MAYSAAVENPRPNTLPRKDSLMLKRSLIIAACLLCLLACDDKANRESSQVRDAAREYVSHTFPDWKIEGVGNTEAIYSADEYKDFNVSVDISKGDARQTILVAVQLFYSDIGKSYWKAEHAPREGEQRISGY